jgi:hypothetical protein
MYKNSALQNSQITKIISVKFKPKNPPHQNRMIFPFQPVIHREKEKLNVSYAFFVVYSFQTTLEIQRGFAIALCSLNFLTF